MLYGQQLGGKVLIQISELLEQFEDFLRTRCYVLVGVRDGGRRGLELGCPLSINVSAFC